MSENISHERGRMLLSWRQVLNRHAALFGQPAFRDPKRWYQFWRWRESNEALVMRQPTGPVFRWAGLAIPWSETTNHLIILGATGAGKSALLRLAMNDILPHVLTMKDHRAVIFDRKNELLPWLTALGIKPIICDPYDLRSQAWNVSEDCQTPADAQQFAEALISSSLNDKDTFWINASRLTTAAVVEAFIALRPKRWTLRDVLLTLRSAKRIEQLLGRHPDTAHVWENIRGDSKTQANLMASLATFVKRYEVVAALWEKCATKFSIRRWATESGGIILIPNHPRYSATLAPIHRMLVNLITDETLSLPDNPERRTFLFMDELRSMGKIEPLYSLANEGRSKGVSLVVGSQSIEGLQEVYGEKLAQEIVGQLRSKVFLRNDSEHTARWVQDHIGQVQYYVTSVSHTSGSSGGSQSSSRTVSHSRRREHLIMASEIMSMPTPKPGGVFMMVNDLPCIGGCFVSTLGFEEVIGAVPPSDSSVPKFLERPREQQRLLEWTAKDIKRLQLPPPSPTASVEAMFGDLLAESVNDNSPA